jgi:hypothetical protein
MMFRPLGRPAGGRTGEGEHLHSLSRRRIDFTASNKSVASTEPATAMNGIRTGGKVKENSRATIA